MSVTSRASRGPARPLRQLVAALLVALTSLVGLSFAAAPAHACSCASDMTLREQLDSADAVVVAAVEKQTQAEAGTDVTLDVVVSRSYKGVVPEARMKVTAIGGSCGYWSGAADQKLLLIVKNGRVDLCGGSRVADQAILDRVQGRLGSGQRIAPPPPAEAVRTQLETDEPREFARLAAPGAAAALLGLLGLAVVSRVQKH